MLVAFIAFSVTVHGQRLEKEKFILYEDVIKELLSASNVKDFENKYDYTKLLLLDSTNIELFEQTGCKDIYEYRHYATWLVSSKQSCFFVTENKPIQEILEEPRALKNILDCLKIENNSDQPQTVFEYPIYIKENIAIFEILGPTWSDIYLARVANDRLEINWLGGIIE